MAGGGERIKKGKSAELETGQAKISKLALAGTMN